MITFQWTRHPDLTDATMLRTQVFHLEQGFSLTQEFDETDKIAYHLVAYLDGVPSGVGRIFPGEGGQWHLGRVAVLPQCRGRHLGAKLMAEMERKAKELGGQSIILSAQCQASGFYATQGYQTQGEEYLDEHCPHIDMVKVL